MTPKPMKNSDGTIALAQWQVESLTRPYLEIELSIPTDALITQLREQVQAMHTLDLLPDEFDMADIESQLTQMAEDVPTAGPTVTLCLN